MQRHCIFICWIWIWIGLFKILQFNIFSHAIIPFFSKKLKILLFYIKVIIGKWNLVLNFNKWSSNKMILYFCPFIFSIFPFRIILQSLSVCCVVEYSIKNYIESKWYHSPAKVIIPYLFLKKITRKFAEFF